jgi:hypothetical protein
MSVASPSVQGKCVFLSQRSGYILACPLGMIYLGTQLQRNTRKMRYGTHIDDLLDIRPELNLLRATCPVEQKEDWLAAIINRLYEQFFWTCQQIIDWLRGIGR